VKVNSSMKGKIIIIVIIAALLGGVFYWFQWRPAQIRKECNQKTIEPMLNQFKSGDTVSFEQSNALSNMVQLFYKSCLYKYGLEK